MTKNNNFIEEVEKEYEYIFSKVLSMSFNAENYKLFIEANCKFFFKKIEEAQLKAREELLNEIKESDEWQVYIKEEIVLAREELKKEIVEMMLKERNMYLDEDSRTLIDDLISKIKNI
jgi:L-rhamnose mutarotase